MSILLIFYSIMYYLFAGSSPFPVDNEQLAGLLGLLMCFESVVICLIMIFRTGGGQNNA